MTTQRTTTMTTTIDKKNRFAMTSALAACFLLSCILSVQGFAATYYWVNDRGNWTTVGNFEDVDGNDASSWNNTFVIDPTVTKAGSAPQAGAEANADSYGADNLTIANGGYLILYTSVVNNVPTLTLNDGDIRNYQSSVRTWGAADGNDKIILTEGTLNQVSLGSSGNGYIFNASIEGAGDLHLRPKAGTTKDIELNAANTHTGRTNLSPDALEGTLVLNNALALQYSTLNLIYDSASEGTVTFNQNSTIGGLEDSGVAANLDLGGRTISIGYDDSARDKTFDGVISNGSIIKIGSSTQRFAGTVSTLVTVTEGTVVMSGSYTGGTIDLAGGNLNIGSDTVAGETMSFDTLTLTDGSTITWQVDGASGDVLQVSNTLALGGLSAGGVTINVDAIGASPVKNVWYTLFDGDVTGFDAGLFTFAGYDADKWVIGEGSLQIMMIPEPSTAILAGLGLAGLCLRRRRR